jgi:hypothetical protein
MKHQKSIVIFLLLGVVVSTFGAGFTFYAADHFYQNQDRIDSTNSRSDHYVDVGLGLDDIGGSGLSLHADAMYSNALTSLEPDGITSASIRQPLQFTTAYLDWLGSEGKLNFRLGRQMFTNLAVEALDFDGLNVGINPNSATRVNLGGGLIVPTPTKKALLSIPDSGQIICADIYNTSIPLTTLNAAFAIEKSLHGENDIRAALGTSVEPIKTLRFDGTGRFSTAVKGLDHLDTRLTFMPSEGLRAAAFFINEKGRIDSLNYFTILMHEELTEFGCLIDYYPEGGGCVQAGYHMTSVKNEGADHFVLVNAANRALDGGFVFGTGYHGLTFRPHLGFNFAMGKYLFLKGSGEYLYWNESNDDDENGQAIVLSGGIKAAIFSIGLTIYPRVEYITNHYYSQDVRFLVTTSLLLHTFWKSN